MNEQLMKLHNSELSEGEISSLITCPSCGSRNILNIGLIPATDLFAGRILSTLLPGGFLYHCSNCDLSFKFPRIHDNELEKLYKLGSLDHWQSEPNVRKDWKIANAWIRTEFPHANILDVGCFDGRFFTLFSSAYKFYGIEINPQAAEKAQQNGVQIVGSDFSSLADCAPGRFDVITAFDVIEHVVDPAEFLKQLTRVVRPGGVIIISTGNALSRAWRLMGSRYYYVTNAEHISFISPQWCAMRACELGIALEAELEFSHAESNAFYIKIKETALNLIYRFFPAFFVQLRQWGLSHKNVELHPELLAHPPNWGTAKGHFSVKFSKKEQKID